MHDCGRFDGQDDPFGFRQHDADRVEVEAADQVVLAAGAELDVHAAVRPVVGLVLLVLEVGVELVAERARRGAEASGRLGQHELAVAADVGRLGRQHLDDLRDGAHVPAVDEHVDRVATDRQRRGAAGRAGRLLGTEERDGERAAERGRTLLEGDGRLADVARSAVAARGDDRAVPDDGAQVHARRRSAAGREDELVAGVARRRVLLRDDDRERRRRDVARVVGHRDRDGVRPGRGRRAADHRPRARPGPRCVRRRRADGERHPGRQTGRDRRQAGARGVGVGRRDGDRRRERVAVLHDRALEPARRSSRPRRPGSRSRRR